MEAFLDERRTTPRLTDVVVVVHQCILTQFGKETWLAAQAIDLSVEGVSLVLNEGLNSGESIYLLTSVRVEKKGLRELEVNGVTSHCRAQGNGQWRVGVKFIDLAPWEKEDWLEFLKV